MSSTQQRSFQSSNNGQTQYRKQAPGGNVNIDYVPEDKAPKSQFKGGEYVDYEEVK